MTDYFLNEIELSKSNFNLDDILSFQLEHRVQIIRGEDHQYYCYINEKIYEVSLTPIYALIFGIKKFKELQWYEGGKL